MPLLQVAHIKTLAGLAAACVLCAIQAQAWAQSAQRVVRVGIYENPPKIMLANSGQPTGILGDLLSRIAARQGWALEAVPCNWHDCLAALEQGNIDLMPDVARTTERQSVFDFHTIASLYSWSQVYARNDKITSPLDMKGLTIAVLDGSVQSDYLQSLVTGFGITAHIVGVNDLEDGFRMVSSGQADAVVANHYFGETHANRYKLVPTPLMFQPAQLFYATTKGKNHDLLEAIDHWLGTWRNNPNSDYFEVLKNWQESAIPARAPAWLWWILGALGLLLALALAMAALLRSQVARQTRHLKASEARLNTILDSADAQIYIKDLRLRYTYVNRKVCDFLGMPANALIGRSNDELFSTPLNLMLRKNDLRVTERGERVAEEEELVSPASGKPATFFSVKIPLRDSHGSIEALCGISTDITAHKDAQAAAYRLAYYDPLTGLPNRQHIIERLDEVIRGVQQGAGMGAVVFLNLDNFKRINDARGHSTGNSILCGVARRLEGAFINGMVARLGGDEFLILLVNQGKTQESAAASALKTAEALHHQLADPFIINDQPYLTAASIGVTLVRPDGKSADDLIREADIAMHRAKAAGGGRAALYESGMQTEVEDRLTLEHDMARAIGTDQMFLFAQGQFNLHGQCVGAELLLRWQHPQRGPVPPSRFIPLAEESDIILRIGDWTLLQACRAIKTMDDTCCAIPLSVNVSPKQFRQPDFVHRVREILNETGANPHMLIFEVTEGILIHDLQGTAERMSELADLGIRFSIDDFGTGYSSLTYLKRLPLYELKIDKIFVQDALTDPDNAAIVCLILAMARQLNLRVVAEGVETNEQAGFLQTQRCDVLQGYYLHRPMPLPDWIALQTQEPATGTV
jgi:diguanylate cyclase (GGDEF)-like protein/PAS domain S-box-containing protein